VGVRRGRGAAAVRLATANAERIQRMG